VSAAEALLLGDSPAIRRLRRIIERVAPSRLSVLIEGPTGSGKELVAAQLHQLSGRRGALVAFNVCAIGETMFEDALFGHVRGAYTGAGSDAPGFLREAHGGTAFLDEIGGLPAMLQPKLLRALETGVFRPIGGARDTTSDFRLVTATNDGIESLVAAGRFRADLAHRLSGFVVAVPPLSERMEDLPLLARHFARGRSIDSDALRLLGGRPWPGNVRELKQVVEAALVFARGSIDASAIEQALANRLRTTFPSAARVVSDGSTGVRAYDAADALAAERARVIDLLEGAAWDTERVATHLGVHRSTLYRRLKRLGVALPPAMCVREGECAWPCVGRGACANSRESARIAAPAGQRQECEKCN
jgi:two-component system NtrC family response regulator